MYELPVQFFRHGGWTARQERLENKRGWLGGGGASVAKTRTVTLCNIGIMLQIYDHGLSVSSNHGCVHRNASSPFVNNRSVSLMDVSENVHPALPELF